MNACLDERLVHVVAAGVVFLVCSVAELFYCFQLDTTAVVNTRILCVYCYSVQQLLCVYVCLMFHTPIYTRIRMIG